MDDLDEDEAVPDGTRYPWVQDLDGVWHKRPADDTWTPAVPDAEVAQARSICSAGPVHSVRTSAFRPDEIPLRDDETMCGECVDLDARGKDGQQ